MQATPSGEPVTLEFSSQLLYLSEPSPHKISISFDDITLRTRYQAFDKVLQKVNYKTVVAGLKGLHPNIITARLGRNSEQEYELTISVAYEFLPEVVEKIVFASREIPAQQSDQVAVRNMRITLKGLRNQLATLSNLEVMSGKLQENTQVYVALNHKFTVFTWALTFENFNASEAVKPQMYYYNSANRQRKTSGAMPEEGFRLHQNGNGVFAEIKFVAELEDFDMVLFRLPGKYSGEYTLTIEKVQQAE